MTRIVAIIQARMGSTRLPGKVLQDLQGQPLLGRVVERIRRARTLDDVVIATTRKTADDAICEFSEATGVPVFRGSEGDVLDRYAGTARVFNADAVVRLTADCPLLDPVVIDRVVGKYLEGGYDYVSNLLPPTYPDGLDTEVFSADALFRARREAALKSEREHVTPYMRSHPELFRQANVERTEDASHLRLTVDEPADLELVRRIYAAFEGRPFGLDDILNLFRVNPGLLKINAGIGRDEGYLRSMREDGLTGSEVRSK